MRALLRIAFAALLLTTAGCGGDAEFTPDDSTGDAPAGPDRFAIQTRGQEVKLGLTDEAIYFRLSDETLQNVDQKLRQETGDRSALGAVIAATVTQSVSSALRSRMQYRLEDIRDVRYEDGRLAIEFQNPAANQLDLEVNGEPVQTQFAPEDARRFAEEFRRAKERGAR